MTATTDKQPTCADRWQSSCDSRLDDIRLMLQPRIDDVQLIDDGTLDTVLRLGDVECRLDNDHASAYRDDDGELRLDDMLLDGAMDDLTEAAYERFYEYGLSFEYVEPNATKPRAGYWCFLISYGGPSEELRFYTDQSGYVYRVEFWFLGWFDSHGEKLDGEHLDIALAAWDALTGGETPALPTGCRSY